MSRKPARSQELGLFAQSLYIEFSILFYFYFLSAEGWLFSFFFFFSPPRHAFLGFFPHCRQHRLTLLPSHHGPDEPPCAGGGLLQKHEVPDHPQPYQCHAQHLLGGKEGRLEVGDQGPAARFGAESQCWDATGILCRMRQQSIPFGTTVPGGIPGRWVRSPPAFWGWVFWRTPGVMFERGGGGAEFPRSCCIPCQLHQHVTSRGFAVMHMDASPSTSIRTFHPKYPSVFPMPRVFWAVPKVLEGSVLHEPATVPCLGALPPALAAAGS